MPLTRGKRIVLELLGPSLVGTAIYMLVMAASAPRIATALEGGWARFIQLAQMFGLVLVFACLFTGLQSIVYVLVMEWRFARGLDPRSWRSVGWSTALGFLSGAVIVIAYGTQRSDARLLWLYFGGIGLAVGFVLGLLIKRWSPPPAPDV